MRVAVIVSVLLFGSASLAGCSSSRFEYGDAERYRERESRDYFQDEERQARRRARAKARAAARARARARARQERAEAAARSRDQKKIISDGETQRRSVAEPAISAPPARPVPKITSVPPVVTTGSESAETAKKRPSEASDEAARAASRKQIEEGYRLLRAGFVKKARERFEQAMSTNASDASLAQGRSMDPSYLKTVAFPDVVPDAEQARRMYRRALLLGNEEAKGDLERLERAMAAAAPINNVPPSSPGDADPAGQSPVPSQ